MEGQRERGRDPDSSATRWWLTASYVSQWSLWEAQVDTQFLVIYQLEQLHWAELMAYLNSFPQRIEAFFTSYQLHTRYTSLAQLIGSRSMRTGAVTLFLLLHFLKSDLNDTFFPGFTFFRGEFGVRKVEICVFVSWFIVSWQVFSEIDEITQSYWQLSDVLQRKAYWRNEIQEIRIEILRYVGKKDHLLPPT